MTFDEKVRFLRAQPLFKVVQENELKALAFAAKEKANARETETIIARLPDSNLLVLAYEDIEKIVRVYPDLAAKLQRS